MIGLQVCGIQALGGTGALRLAADFLRTQMKYDTVYVSKPTWGKYNPNPCPPLIRG